MVPDHGHELVALVRAGCGIQQEGKLVTPNEEKDSTLSPSNPKVVTTTLAPQAQGAARLGRSQP